MLFMLTIPETQTFSTIWPNYWTVEEFGDWLTVLFG
jgi:hypothetical protein